MRWVDYTILLQLGNRRRGRGCIVTKPCSISWRLIVFIQNHLIIILLLFLYIFLNYFCNFISICWWIDAWILSKTWTSHWETGRRFFDWIWFLELVWICIWFIQFKLFYAPGDFLFAWKIINFSFLSEFIWIIYCWWIIWFLVIFEIITKEIISIFNLWGNDCSIH